MAIVSKNHLSISFKFKSETERGSGSCLLVVLKILCGMMQYVHTIECYIADKWMYEHVAI